MMLMLSFGSGPMFIIWSLSSFDPMSSGSGRVIIAGLASIIFCFISREKLPKTFIVWIFCGAYGLLSIALPFLMVPIALKYISTSELAIYLSSIPIFVLLLARIFLKEFISIKKWIGFFIGIVGLVILSEPQNFNIVNFKELVASILCITISICLAGGGIIIQKMPKCHPISFSSGAFFISSLFVLPIFILFQPGTIPPAKPLISLIIVGVFSTFIGQLLRVILVRRAGAVFTSINGYLVPLATCSFGIMFLSETLTVITILSFLIVITGVIVAQDVDKNLIIFLKRFLR